MAYGHKQPCFCHCCTEHHPDCNCGQETGIDRTVEAPMTKCFDCNRPYGSAGFPDLIIPNDAWRQISPSGDEGGLLCPSCMIARLSISGIACEGAFMSGPITSVSRELMTTMRWVENLREQGHGWACPKCSELRENTTKTLDNQGGYNG